LGCGRVSQIGFYCAKFATGKVILRAGQNLSPDLPVSQRRTQAVLGVEGVDRPHGLETKLRKPVLGK
jgi:hypothetical protein